MIKSLSFGILTLSFLLSCTDALAQIPQGISYQAIARQSDGDELINTPLSVKLGVVDASSILEYEEVHSTTSNDYGLINLIIGQGVITGNGSVASFSEINWGSGDHFLRVEIDYPGSSGFELIGESQLLSVPYALFAAASGPVEEQDGDITNELIQSVTLDQQNGNLTITEGENTFEVVIPLNDADADPNNELITSAGLTGGGATLEIEQQGQTISVDMEPVMEATWQEEPGRVFNNSEDIGIGTTLPSSSLHVQGSYSAAVQVLTGPQLYQATDADQVLICNVTSGSITLTLPDPATCAGRMYSVRKTFDTGIGPFTSNTLTIQTTGAGEIEFASSFIMTWVKQESAVFISDGINWYLVSYSRNEV